MTHFNYAALPPEAATLAQQAAARIKQQAATAALAAIQIGSDLALVKGKLEHGRFTAWLQAEFNWSHQTARRYMRLAEKFAGQDVRDVAIGLRTLEYLARDSVSDDDRATALELARENGGLTYTSAASLLGGVRHADSNPSYVAPQASQIIIFDDDDLDDYNDPPDNPEDWVSGQASVPVGRMTLTRTTERERITETAALDVYEAVQQPLPPYLLEPIYIDPVQAYHEPSFIKLKLEQLGELYYLASGQAYRYIPRED